MNYMGITLQNDNLIGIFHIAKLLKQFSINWIHIIVARVTPVLIVSRVLVLLPVLLTMTKSIQTIKNMDAVPKLHALTAGILARIPNFHLRKLLLPYLVEG
jgi:hypothetical protein